jgi:hypothetical protein
MEPVLIMKTASVLLAISALGGMTMAGIRFAGKPQPPTWLAMLHGFLSAAAVTLLLYAYFTVGLPALASWALLLFLIWLAAFLVSAKKRPHCPPMCNAFCPSRP